MLALVLSTMGDIFLLWPGKQGTFIAGLLSFLTAHVLYIVVFAGCRARQRVAGLVLPRSHPYALLHGALFGAQAASGSDEGAVRPVFGGDCGHEPGQLAAHTRLFGRRLLHAVHRIAALHGL